MGRCNAREASCTGWACWKSRRSHSCLRRSLGELGVIEFEAENDRQNVFLYSLFTRTTFSHVLAVFSSGVVLLFILVGPISAHKIHACVLRLSRFARKSCKTIRRVSRSAPALYATSRKHRTHPRG